MKRKTHEEFVSDLKGVTDEITVIGSYINSKEKIEVKCNKCGHEWLAAPSNLLNGNKCPKCYGTPKKTNDEFLKEIKDNNYNLVPLEEYIDAKTKIKFRCNICNHEWLARPNQILRGKGCPKCFGTPRKTNEFFINEMKNKKPYVEVLEEYKDAHTKIKFKCKKCNHKWKDSPLVILHKGLCPNCHQSLSTKETLKNYNIYYYGNEVKTHENFIKEVAKISPKIEVLGEYKSRTQNIRVKCKECGYEWNIKAMYLLMGRVCPECYLGYQSSFFEQCLFISLGKILGKNNIKNRDKKAIGKELDIYIPSKKMAIEYGSWFWHSEKLDKDVIKYQACKEKDIHLLTIYDHYNEDSLEDLFEGNVLTFKEDIGGDRKNIDLLMEELQKTFDKLNIKHKFSLKEVEIIKDEAELVTRRKTTSDFIEQLSKANNKVTIIGEYTRLHNKIHTKCNKCGHEWYTYPYNLLKGHGCPKCTGIYKKTTEDYKNELYKINDEIEVIGEYIGAKDKIKVKCKICGYIWEPAAGSLLVGHGCPKARYNHNK